MVDDWDQDFEEDGSLEEYVAVDDFGVPSNLLGRHDEALFSMVGRIVMLSATLENRLLTIYQALKGAAQNEYTNLSMGRLISGSSDELHRLDRRPDHRQMLETFLAEAKAVIERRNHYVHNLWPAQACGTMWGWRPSPDGCTLSRSKPLSRKYALT